MKRLIICCDGTWQRLTSPYPTNVVKSAKRRWAITQSPLYRPKSLKPYQQWLDAFIP